MNTISFAPSAAPQNRQHPPAPQSEIEDRYIPSDPPETPPLGIYTRAAWTPAASPLDGALACDHPLPAQPDKGAHEERDVPPAPPSGRPAQRPFRPRTTIYVPIRGRTLRIPIPNLPSWVGRPR